VNVGCVPKKVMFNASTVHETLHQAKEFGFAVPEGVTFDWGKIKLYRDRYIKRLNGIYEGGLQKLNIDRIAGIGSFESANTIVVTDDSAEGTAPRKITAEHVLIAVGGAPNKLGVPGEEFCIDSDGFFELEQQPKKVAVLGAGYIAVELAGVFHGLGTDTTLLVRGERALRTFDATISAHLDASMKKSGTSALKHHRCCCAQSQVQWGVWSPPIEFCSYCSYSKSRPLRLMRAAGMKVVNESTVVRVSKELTDGGTYTLHLQKGGVR
jgi:glutathione reductase (NADPH)